MVSEQGPQDVLRLRIWNNGGMKAVRTGGCRGSNWHETQPGAPAQASAPSSLARAHTEHRASFSTGQSPENSGSPCLMPGAVLSFLLPPVSLSLSSRLPVSSPVPPLLLLSSFFAHSLPPPSSPPRDPTQEVHFPCPQRSSAKANRDQYRWVSRMWFPWQQRISCLRSSQPWAGCRGDSHLIKE